MTLDPSSHRAATLLLVDDENDILTSLAGILKREFPGVRIVTAGSGAEALRILAQEPVHLMVVDYRMPAMNGLEVALNAREVQRTVGIIMMTAYPDPELAAQAVHQHGVGLVMAKPFDLTYFAQVLSSFLERLVPFHATNASPSFRQGTPVPEPATPPDAA